jgi:hypothetical protein
MGRVAALQQQSRASARRRRIALDHDRAVRDQRVEAATAQAILALGERDDALGQVRAAQGRVGAALRRIIAEGIKVDAVSALCDVSVGEVRRLLRAAEAGRGCPVTADTAGRDPAGDVRVRPDVTGPPEAAVLPDARVDVTVQAPDGVQAGPRGVDPPPAPPGQPATTARTR